MSLRPIYKRRRIIIVWSLVVVMIIALYHKLNLNFNVLSVYPPHYEEKSFERSFMKVDELEKRIEIRQRFLEKNTALVNHGSDEWKLKMVYYYLNITKEKSIFPAINTGRYVMLNSRICTDTDEVDVVIIVHTAPNNTEKRQRIRNSFAKKSSFYPFEVRVAFLMGKPRDERLLRVLFAEHTRYNDTIMGDFYDDYHNLTLKGVMGYRWISQYCSNAQFILKIDDDVIIDTYKLLTRYIPHMHGKQRSFFCNVWRKNMRIERSGKWMVPKNVFQNTTVFPFYYCSGFTLLISRDLIPELYNAAKVTPLFWIDDLYLFGILPFIVGGVTFYDYQISRNISISQEETYDCFTKLGLQCSFFSTLVSQGKFWGFWKKIRELNDQSSWKALTFFEP